MRVGAGSELWSVPGGRLKGARWDPHFWDEKYEPLLKSLERHDPKPFGDYIESITYGQVGKRVLSPRGTVRYLQVVNIRDTGIDFDIKPDRLREGSHNDLPRSRIRQGDLLLTNTAFGGMSRLLGRCVIVVDDPGKANVSQDMDLIRVHTVNPFFVCTFLKSSFGQGQLDRLRHGVRSIKFSFEQVKQIQIPSASDVVQSRVEREYRRMHAFHRAALDRRASLGFRPRTKRVTERVLDGVRAKDPKYARLEGAARSVLEHLLKQLEAFLRGETDSIAPWPGTTSRS